MFIKLMLILSLQKFLIGKPLQKLQLLTIVTKSKVVVLDNLEKFIL